jgi:hypothetical protein
MPQNSIDVFSKMDVAMSLLRCADNALLSGDDCSLDVVATHIAVVDILTEVKHALMAA